VWENLCVSSLCENTAVAQHCLNRPNMAIYIATVHMWLITTPVLFPAPVPVLSISREAASFGIDHRQSRHVQVTSQATQIFNTKHVLFTVRRCQPRTQPAETQLIGYPHLLLRKLIGCYAGTTLAYQHKSRA
jgi:hypothetical protein